MPHAQILPIDQLDEAVALLRAGEVIAFPTDTVYGLAALPSDGAAVRRLFTVKRRPVEKAIPVLLADPNDLPRVAANVLPTARRLVDAFWPGALTIVVRRSPAFRTASEGADDTVAVRVPALDGARELIRRAGGALAVTSANLSGKPAATDAAGVFAQIGRRIPLILDGGATPGGRESSVVDCSRERPHLIREGAIPLRDLERAARTRIF